ncbi:MAG TPA: glycosyltransferase family 39 protein [Blastocatellia bacterium]
MALLCFVLVHLAVAAILAIIAFALGRRLTWTFKYGSIWEEAAFSLALGLGVLAYSTFVLGLLGLLYRPVVLAGLAVSIIACRRVWASWITRLRASSKDGRYTRFRLMALWGAAVLCLTPIWLLPLYPPVAWDATMYHLAIPKAYVQAHHLIFTPLLRFSAFPQTNEMLFTLSLLVHDDITAQEIEFLILIAVVCAIIGFGKRFFSLRASILSAALFIQSPVVLLLGSNAMVDLTLALWTWLALYALYIWFESEKKSWLVLAGVLCGLAVGTKYTGLVFVSVFVGLLVYDSFRRKRHYGSAARFGLMAFLVACPWLFRNFYYTRNPVFPFLYSWFGRFGWGRWKPEYQGTFVNFETHGMGKGLSALISLPWNLIAHYAAFGAWVSPLCLVLPVILLVLGYLPRRAGPLLALGIAYTLLWFFAVQEGRFLLPALPLLCVASAAGLDTFCARLLSPRTAASPVVTIALATLMILPGLGWACARIRERGRVPVTAAERDNYLAARLPAYPAVKFLNDNYGSNYSVYGFNEENIAYFVDGRFMGDHFGPARYSLVEGKLTDPVALVEVLKGMGAGYLLIAGDFARQVQEADPGGRLKVIYSAGGVLVFDISASNANAR